MNARSLAITRAVAVIGGTGALIIGATFAAGADTASLTGNTFSASQGLLISNGGAYSGSATGFNFGTVPTGTTGSAQQAFFLKDITGGTSPLGVTVTAANCSFSNLDSTKVNLNIEEDNGSLSGTVDTATLASLCTPTGLALSTANLPQTGAVGTKYVAWLTLTDASAITGSPTSGAFDAQFTGAQ
jgi:hypothetical protein